MSAPASGKAFALTVVTPIRRGFGPPTRALLAVITVAERVRLIPFTSARRIRLIHNGRWMVVPGSAVCEDPHRSYLLFSAVYNGPWDQYIDAFALIPRIRVGVNLLWLTSSGFPKARRLGRFKQYIRDHETPPIGFHTYYPQATVRDIDAALELREPFEELWHDVTTLTKRARCERDQDEIETICDERAKRIEAFYRAHGHLLRSASRPGATKPHNARPAEDS